MPTGRDHTHQTARLHGPQKCGLARLRRLELLLGYPTTLGSMTMHAANASSPREKAIEKPRHYVAPFLRQPIGCRGAAAEVSRI
jgi:hypothetical protein